jgi:hypothetical protein
MAVGEGERRGGGGRTRGRAGSGDSRDGDGIGRRERSALARAGKGMAYHRGGRRGSAQRRPSRICEFGGRRERSAPSLALQKRAQRLWTVVALRGSSSGVRALTTLHGVGTGVRFERERDAGARDACPDPFSSMQTQSVSWDGHRASALEPARTISCR